MVNIKKSDIKKYWKEIGVVVLVLVCMVVAIVNLLPCKNHKWVEATCTEPITCSRCGEVKGEPLGHKLKGTATCVKTETCSRCNAYMELGNHDLKDWEVKLESTCAYNGLKVAECKNCDFKKEEELIKSSEHEWVSEDGKIVCELCGEKK